MGIYDCFISSVPDPLPEDVLYKLLCDARNGSLEARNEVISHNIKLVLHIVRTKYYSTGFEMEDLVSTGMIGLIKAVNNYNINKGIKFTSFAGKCIENEIRKLIRKEKNKPVVSSLENNVYSNNGNSLKQESMIFCDIDLEDEYIKQEEYERIREFVKNLPERYRTIVELYFGFNDNVPMTQEEIGKRLNMSRSWVCKNLKHVLYEFEKRFTGNADTKIEQTSIQSIDMANVTTKGKSFYEHYKGYSKAYLDRILTMLLPEDLELLKKRYGGDLNNHFYVKLCYDDYKRYYNCILPKIGRLIESNGEMSKSGRRQKRKQKEQTPLTIDKNMFIELANKLSPKEAVIAALRFGVVDGIHYSTTSLSNYFGMDSIEVIGILKNALEVYKECITEQENDKIPSIFDI